MSSTTNARRFLDAFAAIEDHLARKQGQRSRGDDWVEFTRLVEASDELTDPDRRRLREAARLRNAIAHKPYRDGDAIADPRIDIVEQVERIQANLEKPPIAMEVLAADPPRVFVLTDTLIDFAELVRAPHHFSQAPVRTETGYRLVTTNAVARWYVDALEHKGGAVHDPELTEVMGFAEDADRVKILSKRSTAVQAIRLLTGEAGEAVPPAAIIFTLTGRQDEGALGIATQADLGVLYRALDRAS
ncbi:hypothetical protein [Microbacterium sp.]|uniref:hypothetical protein n=1 Tax=Microbacterium sp. TaxID=51671 RepID=UPI003A8DA2D8